MALPAGGRLGPYQILSPAGSGGQGEVYKARDTRLERTVAVKVLPADVASDPAARERFEREARAVAALNHTNICVLHDVGRHEGVDFLVWSISRARRSPRGSPAERFPWRRRSSTECRFPTLWTRRTARG